MIKEAYVSSETSKLLKEKGFDEEVISYYDTEGQGYFVSPRKCNIGTGSVYAAPTQQMAMQWLRKKKLLNIDVSIYNGGHWSFLIEDITCPFDGGITPKYCGHSFNSYEEALEAGIQYCLKNFIKEKNMKHKVFLGGTCNESTWRDELIPMLHIDYFNPVVKDWTLECQAEEERQKNEECDYQLYVITPRMTGVFSIAEVIEAAITRHDKAIFCIIPKDGELEFTKGQLKSLNAVGNMVVKHQGVWCKSLEEVAGYLNSTLG